MHIITLTHLNILYKKRNPSASFNGWSGGEGIQADEEKNKTKTKQSLFSHYSSSCKAPLSPLARAAQPEHQTAVCPFLQS